MIKLDVIMITIMIQIVELLKW